MKKVLVGVVLLGLCGCAVAQKIENREAVNQSLAAYKSCLGAHPAAPNACEAARLAYEADLERQRNQAPAAVVSIEH